MNRLIHADCIKALAKIPDNSVDLLCTDPPYGYSFMGKDWDKAVPSVATWRECLRVLKPGAFAFVMSAPRQDVLSQMIARIADAGFATQFSPLYWTYANGFPKAANIGKAIDKRLGAARKIIGTRKQHDIRNNSYGSKKTDFIESIRGGAQSAQAKALDGGYGGFQPKPAVEVIIVAMKPLSETTYVGQAQKNGKGVTWLDDGRIPYRSDDKPSGGYGGMDTGIGKPLAHQNYRGALQADGRGRFPANLMISDHVLGDYSRFFSLDAWADALPFLVVPKASRAEKGKTCTHPTVKPLKLMLYLITLGSRPADVVLDPFLGSGTTAVAAKMLDRRYIGIEQQREYLDLARTRVAAATAC